MASTKRTSAESGEDDDQENEASDPLFQQEDDVKRAKLSPLSDTTLHDLPIEMLDCILVKVVVMEVKDMKLAKSVWKEKADLVISRLRSVCSQWSSILTTNFFQRELQRTLDSTAHQTIRLEILYQCPMQFDVEEITTLKDEIFMLCSPDEQEPFINVFDRNSLALVKDVIQLREGRMSGIAACNVSNCLYVGIGNENCDCHSDCHCFSVLRITKDEEHQFKVSSCISDHKTPLAGTCISVTANGSVMILSDHEDRLDLLSIYDANGSLQHEIVMSLYDDDEFSGGIDAFQKSNGNLVLVGYDGRTYLVEIDQSENVVRRYRSSLYEQCNVTFGDIYGRIMITGFYPFGGMELLDSEFNLLEFSKPQLDEDEFCYIYSLHFNSEWNEVMCMSQDNNCAHDLLTIFRFTEE